MSMLAERKRRQRWSLNPRGNMWAKDTNKFGKKLLEKMGWKEGKGLGVNEDGVKEHIRVSYKNDSKGLGFKDKDEWTEHEDKFSALLQDLLNSEDTVKTETSDDKNEFKPESLEKKSQHSRVRLHYHKFTRGKDLSQYSEKDLANIFGKKSLQETQDTKMDEQTNKENVNGSINDKNEDNDFGVKTISGGSMINYFKSKLPSFYKSNTNQDSPLNSDSEDFSRVGFGFISNINTDINITQEDLVETSHSGKKKTKKKKKEVHISVNHSFSFESENEIPLEENSNEVKYEQEVNSCRKHKVDVSEETPKKKKHVTDGTVETFLLNKEKKKNKGSDVNNANIVSSGLSNLAFDPLSSNNIVVEKHILDTINEEEESPVSTKNEIHTASPKKKKKRKSTEDVDQFTEDSGSPDSTKNGIHTVSPNKKKKRKSTEGVEQFTEDSESPAPRKRKKKTNEDGCFENPNFGEDNDKETVNNNFYEVRTKKKKKKKSKKENNVENLELNSVNYVPSVQDPTENKTNDSSLGIEKYFTDSTNGELDLLKKSKKKLKHMNGIVNPNFVDNNSTITDSSNIELEVNKKSKKSKKSKNLEGIDNPSINISTSSNDFESPVRGEGIEETSSEILKKQDSCGSVTSNSDCILNVSDEPDIMLNISFGPPDYLKQTEDKKENANMNETYIIKTKSKPDRRKSVRFSDINEQHTIPNRLDEYYSSLDGEGKNNDLPEINVKILEESRNAENSTDFQKGLINEGFDFKKDRLENNIHCMNEKINNYQMEIENDMNESKDIKRGMDNFMIGEPVTDGENEKLEDGTKLRLKYARFGKLPYWMRKNDSISYAKKSYRHLIKGNLDADPPSYHSVVKSLLGPPPSYNVIIQSCSENDVAENPVNTADSNEPSANMQINLENVATTSRANESCDNNAENDNPQNLINVEIHRCTTEQNSNRSREQDGQRVVDNINK